MLLDQVTGERAVITQVLGRQESPRKECFLVSGPPGCGISWTLNQMGIEWERRGGVALKATGAAVTPPRTLLPWLTMASPARGTLARWEILKGGAAEASKAIPVIGEAASYLVNEVLNYRRKKLARQTQVLGEKEQDLLFVIETAAHGKRLLLLIDQLSNWDDESWGLLELIISPLIQDFYSSLRNVLIVMGSGEDTLPRSRILVEKLPFVECRLQRLQRENLSVALEAFDFPMLGNQEMGLLYEATGGRLDLLNDFGSLSRDLGVTGLVGEGSALYGRLIERRLRALKGDVAALEGLLTAASFLGNSFSPEEACCLTGYGGEELQAILRLAEDERLLGITDGYVSFHSVAMQQYFRSSRIGDPGKYHRKFAECLRQLRPGDYETRCQHLLLAGETNNALVCHCLASLDARRRRRALPEPKQLRSANDWHEFASYLESMFAAYAAYDRDAVQECLSILESIEAFLPDALVAERDYLEAQIRLKSHRVSDFERAVVSLERWLSLEVVEPEIWSRVAQALIVGLTETDRNQEASELEEALTKYYGARRTLDPWALYGLNCLRRRSECLHHLVPARNRLQNALAYFGPATAGTLPRHPLQYYYTLTNLVSNLIASGSFAEATVRGAELKGLVQGHFSFNWPALEVPANNSVLAGYLAGVLPLSAATDLLRQIDERRNEGGDQMLIHNNLAVLLIHGGELEKAQQILTAVQDQLGEKSDSDAYHRYFVTNNLAGLFALAGEQSKATQMIADAGQDLNRLYPAIRETLMRRHAMMPEALVAAPSVGAEKFDSFLKDHFSPQMGPQWAFYGRGFLLSDIQFWAAD
jgi:hypothetical protein